MRGIMRKTLVGRTMQGGCYTCHGGDAVWFQNNAQGLAAQHHDKTGHPTWVDIVTVVRYGDIDPSQPSNTAPRSTGHVA